MTVDQEFRDRQCSKLQAQVHFVGYDYEKKIGYVVLADDNCVDMTACIQMFEGIDLLDPTKLVPEELAPVQVMRWTLSWLIISARERPSSAVLMAPARVIIM